MDRTDTMERATQSAVTQDRAEERRWLASVDPAEMVEMLGPAGLLAARGSERKLRLFGCALVRSCWGRIADGRIGLACQAAERFADGRAGAADLAAAREAAAAAMRLAGGRGTRAAAQLAHAAAADGLGDPRMFVVSAAATAQAAGVDRPHQAAILRDLFGNPFRLGRCCATAGWLSGPAFAPAARPASPAGDGPVPLPPHHTVSWGPDVSATARSIYDRRAFERLHVLDAVLVRAGCTCEDLLRHVRGYERCRVCAGAAGVAGASPARTCPLCGGLGWAGAPDMHVRGCWALDLVLGY